MSKRLQDIVVADPILSTVARGYTPTESFMWDQIFPIVDVEKENGKVRTFGKEYYRTYQSKRALNAGPNIGKGTASSKIPYQLSEYEISLPLDYREKAESPDNLEAEYTELAMRHIMLGFEEEIAGWIQDPATYEDGHTEALTGTDKFDDPGARPIELIDDAKQTVASKIGLKPNTLVLSEDSVKALRQNPAMIELIKYSQMGVIDIPLLRTFFGIENILIAESTITNASDQFVSLWNACAALFYIAPPGKRSQRNPSWGYTFRLKGWPKGDKWPSPDGKVTHTRATTIQDSMILMPEAGFLITGTVGA